MNKEHSLEEDNRHGTEEKPIAVLHFSPEATPQYAKHFMVERHWHHEIEILYVRKGTFHLELNLENFTLQEGDICFINSGELHFLEGNEPGTVHDAVIFNPQILKFAYHDVVQDELIGPLLARQESLPHIIRNREKGYEEIAGIMQRIGSYGWFLKETDYFEVKLRLYELLFQLKMQGRMSGDGDNPLSAVEKEKIDRYKRIVMFVQEHYMEKIKLETLAAQAQCNPQYLCHFFKEIAEISPIQYLIEYRLDRAREMLKDTTKPVLEVSLDCGFDNVSYFIRQFKKETGVTPGAYRKEAQECSFTMS